MARPEERVTQIIDERLESIVDGRETLELVVNENPDIAGLLREDLEMALLIRSYRQELDPSEPFIRQSKSRLLTRIGHQSYTKSSRKPFFNFLNSHPAIMGAILLVVILLISIPSVAYASMGSIPGDALYPMKRMVERVSISLQTSSPQRSVNELDLANQRLMEIESLVERGDLNRVAPALQEYDEAVTIAVADLNQTANTQAVSKLNLAEKLNQKLTEHLARLFALKDKLPTQAQDGIDQAIMASGYGLTQAQDAIQGIHDRTPTPSPTASLTPTLTPTPTATQISPEASVTKPGNAKGTPHPTNNPTRNPQQNRTVDPTRTPKPTREAVNTPRPTPDKPDQSGQSAQPAKTFTH